MAWIEVVERRAQKVKEFIDDLNATKHRFVATVHDQHYQDGSSWLDVDESLVDDTTDGYLVASVKQRHIVRMGSTGTRRWYPRRGVNEYVSFGRLQSWSGTAWGNVNLGTPTRTGNQIVWDTTNFTLKLTNTWHRIKIEAVLKTEAARRRLRWAVTLNGLTWDDWTVVSQSDSTVVGTVDKPLAWDANGSRDDPNVTITTSYSGGYVEFGGDLSGATLPITIDPTFTDGYGGDATTYKDTTLRSANADTNYGTNNDLEIGYGNPNIWHTLIKFDLSSIPAGSTIDSAVLTLYSYYTNGNDTDAAFSVYRLKRAWVEAEATWNIYSTGNNWSTAGGFHVDDCEQDAIGTKVYPEYPATGEDTWTLTASEIEEMIPSGGWTNNGFLMKSETEAGAATRYVAYRSSDYSTDATKRPSLVVEYTEEEEGTETPLSVAGGMTPSGTIAKSVGKPLAGGATPSGVLTRVVAAARSLAGGDTPSGVLTKQSVRSYVGGATPSGVVVKANLRSYVGGDTPSGTLANVKAFLRTYAGGLTPAGTVIKGIAKGLAGGITPSGVLTNANKVILVVANALQTQVVDNITLVAHLLWTLIVHDSIQSQNAENVALTQHNVLSVQDSTQSQRADTLWSPTSLRHKIVHIASRMWRWWNT